ncbi:MAG: hypothetical protein R3E39_04365 [Anaerolineae bacterium]
MGIRLDCPECGERLTFDIGNSSMLCRNCGYTPTTGVDERAAQIRAQGKRKSVFIRNESEINPRAASLFYTAHDYAHDGDIAKAIESLQRALEIEPTFADAHLWMAHFSDDEAVKRDHLSSILAVDASNSEAARMMLVLNGRLTAEQAAQSSLDRMPTERVAEGPVKTIITDTRCPNCKGSLTINEVTGRVMCSFCGYSPEAPQTIKATGDSLLAAMLERRSQPIKWIIGERLLHCNQCGAERTIAGTQLSTRCPFCGSNQVIEQDALGSFEQPEGLIPFSITRGEASARIKERLQSLTERMKGWFDNNKVASATLNGFYLPFWMFDATADVTRTRIQTEPSTKSYGYTRVVTPSNAYVQSHYQEAFLDVEVCAVTSPVAELTRQLGDYHTRDLVEYDPSLLSKYPAQLYVTDFDQAALEARSYISAAMRQKFGRREVTEDNDVTINVLTNVQQMSFRLILAPVWIATLTEMDKDRRTALVNGQTGQVVLGKSEKPQKKSDL